MIDLNKVREISWETIKGYKLNINKNLPLLDSHLKLKSQMEIANRCLAFTAVVAAVFNFDKIKAKEWLKQEELEKYVTIKELKFLDGKLKTKKYIKELEAGPESLWTLTWILGIIDHFDFTEGCADDLVTKLPNLKIMESKDNFISKIKMRNYEIILEKLDLAYCLHWAIVDKSLNSGNYGLDKFAGILQRRLVLEWVFSSKDWDEITLDT